jgi:outer membrane protein assembly factor BamB
MRCASLLLVGLISTLACTHQPTSVAAAKRLGPTEKWEFRTSKAIPMAHYDVSESSPAIADDGTIYVGGDHGLFAINPDGTERWLYEPPGPVTVSPVIGDDGTIWISSLGELNRVDPDGHGTPLVRSDYAKQVGIGFDGTVYIGTQQGLVEFGSPDRSNRMPLRGEHFAFTSDGRIYITDGPRPLELFLANDKDRGSLWVSGGDYTWPTDPAIAADGTIYITAATQLEAFAENGGGLWSVPADLPASPSIASDGTVYFGSRDNRLYAVNPDGSLKWMFTTRRTIESTPAISKAGFIYFGNEDDKLYSLDANGNERWEFATQGTVYSPTIAPDGTIYVQSADGKLYAIQDSEPNGGLDGQWPKLGGGLSNMARRLEQHGD